MLASSPAIMVLLAIPLASSVTGGNRRCRASLHQLLHNRSSIVFASEEKSLTLQWQNLTHQIQDCANTKLILELWRVTKDDIVETSLGGDYFSSPDNCQNIDPDLFEKYGRSIKLELSEENHIQFGHLVDRSYMLRICPCAGKVKRCSCSKADLENIVCSRIIRTEETSEEPRGFYPWCQKRNASSAPQAELWPPSVNYCPTTVSLSGSIPSCSPIQPYDQVKVTLTPVAPGLANCQKMTRPWPSGAKAFTSLTPLTSRSDTSHGSFSVRLGLNESTADDSWNRLCVSLELVSHPRCFTGPLSSQPSVCRPVLLASPVILSPPSACQLLPESAGNPPSSPILVGCLAALGSGLLVLLVAYLVLQHRRRRYRKGSSDEELCKGDEPGTPLHPQPPASSSILLLYMEDSRGWLDSSGLYTALKGLKIQIWDLYNEDLQEELAESPESWIKDRIQDCSVRIILVDSAMARALLAGGVTNYQSSGLENIKLYAFLQIRDSLYRDYRRLAVVTGNSLSGKDQQPQPQLSAGPTAMMELVPHTRYKLPDHLPLLLNWLLSNDSL